MKYLCVNCKQEFDKIPPMKPNECISGYYHTFIKKSSIIKRREVSVCEGQANAKKDVRTASACDGSSANIASLRHYVKGEPDDRTRRHGTPTLLDSRMSSPKRSNSQKSCFGIGTGNEKECENCKDYLLCQEESEARIERNLP